METLSLLGSALGLGLASGVRLYSTVLAVGLGIRFGWLRLDPALSQLEILSSLTVLVVAGVVYFIEFFADKIPWVDTIWDVIHTPIRPIGAALVGASALGNVDPGITVAGALLCGGIGFTGHASKAGTRLLVNHSPEPVSNIGLSLLEDVFVFVVVWFALAHPLLMLLAAVCFVVIFLWLFPKLVRLVKRSVSTVLTCIRTRRLPLRPTTSARYE